ncbi:MAG: 4'-phosphopantetheinyl transferase superfamily protein [Proteobacteria bacterium]|nr:4'-phosphopantetheinyl transferase superfamily protein [Pseudomonadota bacterium]
MRLRDQVPMSLTRLSHGAIQWTMAFKLEALECHSFLEEGLELPSALQFAVKKRQIEFLAGRLCAKRCFEELGLQSVPAVQLAEDRSPIWPSSVLGSISHTDRIATAIVAHASQVTTLGIDIERVIAEASPQMIRHICCDPDELEELIVSQKLSREQALTLIFSGKESLYKAVYPRLKRFFGFQAARIKSDISGQLSIHLVTELSDNFAVGARWAMSYRMPEDGLMETLVLQPHGQTLSRSTSI